MTRAAKPWSPLEIEVKMREVVERLDEAITEGFVLAQRAGEASHAYRKAQAIGWAKARNNPYAKTDKAKEKMVDEETEALMLERNLAEGAFEAHKLMVRSLQTEADLLRSLGRSSRDLVDSWHGGS